MRELRANNELGLRGWTQVLALAVVVGSGVSLNAADWPCWRGASRDGISCETNLNWSWPAQGPKVLWKRSVGKGFASFAAVDGRIYTLGNRDNVDTVFCLNAATGAEVWKYSYACPLDPLAHEGGPGSTPAIDSERVYALSKAGHYFCFDARKGKLLWSGKFHAPPTTDDDYKVWWGFSGSPFVSGEKVVFSVTSAGAALDKTTGRVMWTNAPGRPGYSSPVPLRSNKTEAFALIAGHEVVAVELESGLVQWRIPWRTTWDQNAADVVVADLKVFVSSGHEVGCALYDLSALPPKQLWRNTNMRNALSSSILWKGHLYGYDAKALTCLDWQSGEVKWRLEDSRQGSLVLVDGQLVTLEENGLLRVVEASESGCHVVAKAQILSGRCWTAPVVADGRLFARNAVGDVVCLDLRSETHDKALKN